MKIGDSVNVQGVIHSDLISIPLSNGRKFVGYKVKIKGYDDPILIYESEINVRHQIASGQYLTDTDFDERRSCLSKNLRAFRIARQVTQAEIGEMVGAFENSVNNWECGRNSPRMEKLLALSRMMGCTVEELTGTELEFAR
jgi:DNA-binding XRE family transcriptional regulator